MDEIRIEGLQIYAGHGVHTEENRDGQIFVVNAVLYGDTRKAGLLDDLSLSAHYGEVSRLVHRLLRERNLKLIEAVAEHVAEQILLTFPNIKALDLEIKKPDAPIKLPFDSVSVKISRGWKTSCIGIGSNLGNKKQYIEEAVAKLKANPQIKNVRISALIETKPYGGVEQEDFLNGALMLETLYTPLELLHFLQSLEKEAGRVRSVHWGPRTLDLDILFYEDFISDAKELTVPHPDMQNREFVLKPLAELCPYYMHPLFHKCVRQMLRDL